MARTDELIEVVKLARQVLARVVERVCGACERNCCHQGTMMGSQDLRRLVRGLALDQRLAEQLDQGLREKAEEVAADVAAAREVLRLVKSAGGADEAAVDTAERAVAQLEAFARTLAAGAPLDYEHLRQLTFHTALRHNVIRAFRAFAGGEGALARFAPQKSSFKFRGRRLAPPRCIFHTPSAGCLAGKWKPAKCANFFCTADPSLLDAIRERMDFDDFVLANFEPIDRGELRELLSCEAQLGPEYHEPLIVIGWGEEAAEVIAGWLVEAGVKVRVREAPRAIDAEVVEEMAAVVPEGTAMVARIPTMRAEDVYEAAIGLDRLRQQGAQRLVVLLVQEYATPSLKPHPLWAEHTIAQPIGYLECYVVSDARPHSGEAGD